MKSSDTEFMKLALKLARTAEGMTSPNPLVGAVLVKNGNIIGQGYHRKAGLPHAEIEAFTDARNKNNEIKSSTLYVNLEPCCHSGKKTPPCTEAIVREQVGRVVVGTTDPNPRVSGKGVEFLRNKGIRVDVGLLENECSSLNEIFFKNMKTGMPFVILKLACSLDGKIATATGNSKWIGSQRQRNYAHRLRNKVDAVLVGVNTVISDNPRLNVRLRKINISQPVPVIIDSSLRISPDSNIFKIHKRPVIATTRKAYEKNISKIKDISRVVVVDEDSSGKVELARLMETLYSLGITSLLIEGGSSTAGSAISSKIVDKVVFFYSPRIIGGDGMDMISKLGVVNMEDSIRLKDVRFMKFGEEFMVEGYPDIRSTDSL